ncbi:MAG: hypothetical protein V1709_02785 [Planctomycetota bacterium]
MQETKRLITIILLIIMILSVFIAPFIIITITNSFTEIIRASGLSLPLPTKFFLRLSYFLSEVWYLWLFLSSLISGGGIYLEIVIKGKKRLLNFWFFLGITLIYWLMVFGCWISMQLVLLEIR